MQETDQMLPGVYMTVKTWKFCVKASFGDRGSLALGDRSEYESLSLEVIVLPSAHETDLKASVLLTLVGKYPIKLTVRL